MAILNYCRQPLCIAFLSFFGFILWIIYAADSGANNVFLRIVDLVPYGDKVAHVLLYGCLALLLNLLLKRKVLIVKSINFQLGSLLVLGFAALEELSQGFFATRNLDAWDLFADVLGVYLAALLVTCKKGAH
jgi:hypothetical protein